MTRRKFGSIEKHTTAGLIYWRASYPTPDEYQAVQKRIRKIFPYTAEGRRQAENWLDTAHLQILAGSWQPPTQRKARNKVKHITFDTYWPDWVENRHKTDGSRIKESSRNKHLATIRCHLSPYFGRMSLTDITSRDIQDWYDAQPVTADGKGLHARYRAYTILHAILETAATSPIDAQGDTVISQNPCHLKLQKPGTKHHAVIAEISDLDKLAAGLPESLQLTVYIAGLVGLRIGEVCALQRRDIDLNAHTIQVNHNIIEVYRSGHRHIELSTPKTSTSKRIAVFPEALAGRLEAHLSRFTKPEIDAQLFTGAHGGLLAPQSLKNAWNKAKTRAGMEDMWFHDLRKTALTRMMEAGATVGEVMAQAGHASIDVASQYQKQSKSHQYKVMQNLDNLIASEHKKPQKTVEETKNSGSETEPLIRLLKTLPADRQEQVIAALPADKQVIVLSRLLA